jgi:hypothetical protein
MESGKTSKYLKYAIGEIILVVIGILIALQINNWNIDNANHKAEQQYLKRLIVELDDEIENYTYLKEGFIKQQTSINELLKIWNQPQPVIKDSAGFWPKFFAASGAGPWYKEPVTWTQLVQSGEMKLIQDKESVETLFKHYSNLERVAKNFSEYPTQTTSEARKFIATTYSETDLLIKETDYRPFFPDVQFMTKIFENKKEFRVLFVRVGVIAGFHRAQMEDLIISAENAKKKLTENINVDD